MNSLNGVKQKDGCQLKRDNVKIKFRSKNGNTKINFSWIGTITVVTLVIATVISYISLIFMDIVPLPIAMLILLAIVTIGICSDILGIAVTAAEETPFHSMSASKVPASKESIWLIRNASIVSNFCNDVIGDICGIISGSASTAIIAKILLTSLSFSDTVLNIAFAAFIAAFTVGGKALGKEIALRHSNYIVYKLAGVMHMFKRFIPGKN